jgi:hypothetical protein
MIDYMTQDIRSCLAALDFSHSSIVIVRYFKSDPCIRGMYIVAYDHKTVAFSRHPHHSRYGELIPYDEASLMDYYMRPSL